MLHQIKADMIKIFRWSHFKILAVFFKGHQRHYILSNLKNLFFNLKNNFGHENVL